MGEKFEPTPYTVSTITCNGSLGITINPTIFFNNVKINDDKIIWVEYLQQSRGTYPRKLREKKNFFDNQVTILYKMGDRYFPNCKIFQNGNIQMTGIRSIEDGHSVIDKIGKIITEMVAEGVTGLTPVNAKITSGEFIIRMINSNFGFNFNIRRKNLHKLLISPQYNNSCSFEPMGYPGVKLQYFWNKQNTEKDGVCKCSKMCFGKGKGNGDNNCKKVTIAIFESGNVLITGGNAFEQVDDAYDYIVNVVKNNRQEIEKVALVATE